MYHFWVVLKLELRLIRSSRVSWLLLPLMLVIGAMCATNNRSQPWQTWPQIHSATFFISLILAFWTGNGISRDREERLAEIVFSTPVATAAYVGGKFAAGLLSLLLLAASSLLAALLVDRFYGIAQPLLIFAPVYYPPIGAQPYLIGWAWFALTGVVFGAAFMLAAVTLTDGQRAIASCAIALIWILPRFFAQAMPELLDLTGTVFYRDFSLAPARPVTVIDPLSQFLQQHPAVFRDGPPPAELVQPLMSLTLAALPPAVPPPDMFVWNRLFFAGIALALLAATVYGTSARRRRAG